jgi:hypothetical protein
MTLAGQIKSWGKKEGSSRMTGTVNKMDNPQMMTGISRARK